MLNVNNISNAVSSNKNIYNAMKSPEWSMNKTYLVNSYQADKTLYYNDEQNKKKEKKHHLAKILGLSFAGLTIASAGFVVAMTGVRKKKLNIDQADIKNFTNKATNFLINTATIKDDLLHRFAIKLKKHNINFLDNFGEKLKSIYNNIAIKNNEKEYDDLLNKVRRLKDKEHIEIKDLPENFEDYALRINNSIKHDINKEGSEPVTKGLFSIKGRKIKNVISELKETLTTRVLADEKIENTINKYGNTHYEIPESANASEELKRAVDDLNKKIDSINGDLIQRLRDNNFGNALSDALGMLSSLGLLCGSVALADNKEERKSVILNLGIPLSATLASAIWGTAKCYSGGKSILFGLATGQLAAMAAKKLDKLTQPKLTVEMPEENKNTKV